MVASLGDPGRDPAYRDLSLWFDSLPEPPRPRPRLTGDVDADVCIVGAGYTGLWAALYLSTLDPGRRVVVLERETAGFGASGRNGGWCSALFPVPLDRLAARWGADPAVALYRELQRTVDDVGRAAAAEGIDCHYAKGGTVTLARSPAQLLRAEEEVAEARRWGFGPEDVRLLDAAEAADRVGATGVLGAGYTPHCAALHPARLVRGLAEAVERRGAVVYERTPARRIGAGGVETPYGRVRAPHVLRATEGYTAGLPGQRRDVAPVYSLMLATEPLPAEVWDEVGLRRRETFSDHRHLIVYGQRTADDRLAFGGRGAPYHLGSRVRPRYDREPAVFADLRAALVELFPAVRAAAVTHTWGGPLGVTRDWTPSVGLDRASGLGWAGGYVGDGVAAAHLAGRTLADLVLGRDTDRVRLPWVGHRSPRWEPEPLRWLGVNAGLQVMRAADAREARTGRPSRPAAAVNRLIGR
jgi:glycine/D-amino acid oxidase-like deaminating enzyme